jgi:hypothetical protein
VAAQDSESVAGGIEASGAVPALVAKELANATVATVPAIVLMIPAVNFMAALPP